MIPNLSTSKKHTQEIHITSIKIIESGTSVRRLTRSLVDRTFQPLFIKQV